MRKFLTKVYWSGVFDDFRGWLASIILGSAKKELAVEILRSNREIRHIRTDSSATVEKIVPKVMIDPSEDVSIISLTVWNEGRNKCGEHCWHKVPTKSSHRGNLHLGPTDEHHDLVCCRCTHALCHTGELSAELKQYPLKKFHTKAAKGAI
jgi:hypothetical protein